MTEDQIRAAVRAELDPFKKEFHRRFDGIDERLGILGDRLTVASNDRKEMLRILRVLERRRR